MFFMGVPANSHLWWTALPDDEAKKLSSSLLTGPTVDFYVGPERRQWSIHRNLLCHHSPYFEAEFLGSDAPKISKKSGELQLELPDEDPAGFELLVKWLYQGRLDDLSDMSDEKKYDYSVACYKLYMLCDKFNLPLKNEAIDRYRQGLLEAQLVPDAEEINDIYRRSPIASPFRKLMTQIAARQIMDPDTDKDAESYRKCFEDNSDFAVDMINAIKAGTGGVLFDDPTDGNQCDYHDHSDGQKCHLKGKGRLIPSLRNQGKTQPAQALSSAQDKVNRVRPTAQPSNGAVRVRANSAQQSNIKGGSVQFNGGQNQTRPPPSRVNGVGRVNDHQRYQHGGDRLVRGDSILSVISNERVSAKIAPLRNGLPPSRAGARSTPPTLKRRPSTTGTNGTGEVKNLTNGTNDSTSGSESSPTTRKRPPKLRRRAETETTP